MVDTVRLKELVDESGLRKSFICEKLGITRSGYFKKETGKSDFTASEIKVLKGLLKLSNKDVADIFLTEK